MTTASTPFMRPLRLPEILDQAIRLYRNNFVKFIGILALPYIPLIILQTVTSYLLAISMYSPQYISDPLEMITSPEYIFGMLGSLFVGLLYFFLISGLATAALTRAVADHFTGSPVGVIESYRRLGKSWVRLVGALSLMLLLITVGLIWFMVPCVGWLTGLGILFFLGAVVTPLLVPVIVLEDTGARNSIRRAWELARSRFWWLIGFACVLYVLSMLLVTGPTVLIQWIMGLIVLTDTVTLDQQLTLTTVMQSLTSMTASLIYLPLQLIAMTIVYFDLRVRSEGLDLALQTAPATASGGPTMLPAISAPSSGPLVTGQEVGYFILLTLAGAGLYVLFVGLLMGVMLAFVPFLGVP